MEPLPKVELPSGPSAWMRPLITNGEIRVRSLYTPKAPLLSGTRSPATESASRAMSPGSSLNAENAGPENQPHGPADYRITELDVLLIEVFNEADISKPYQVSANGTVNHPLLGAVKLSGLSLSDAESTIRDLLAKDYLVNPRVNIRVQSSAGRRIIIFGEVSTPGTLHIPPDQPMTLLRAVALAGGFTDIAARGRVRIVRRDGDNEENQIVQYRAC